MKWSIRGYKSAGLAEYTFKCTSTPNPSSHNNKVSLPNLMVSCVTHGRRSHIAVEDVLVVMQRLAVTQNQTLKKQQDAEREKVFYLTYINNCNIGLISGGVVVSYRECHGVSQRAYPVAYLGQ